MATPEEKQELVDNLKGKRYYRFSLWGYGGESAYININKEQYDFWKNQVDEHGDSDIVSYMVGAEDGDYELEDIDSIPEEADFMKDDEGGPRTWYEHHNEFSHQWGVPYDSARLTLEEVDGLEWDSKVINEVVSDGIDLHEWINQEHEKTDYDPELVHTADRDEFEDQGDYICQFYSAEKGTFFDAVIETVGDFDPKKLKVWINEFPNGEDIVTSVEYNGEEVDNNGGDTNGKGYSVHLWSNVSGS